MDRKRLCITLSCYNGMIGCSFWPVSVRFGV